MTPKNSRKKYLYIFILFLLGIGTVAAVWTTKNQFLSWTGFILGFILVIASLLLLIQSISQIQIEQDPYYHDDIIRDSWFEKITYWASVPFIFLGIMAVRISHMWGNNIVHELAFYITATVFAFLFSVLLGKMIKKIIPSWFIHNEARDIEMMCYGFGSTLFIVSILTMLIFKLPISSKRNANYKLEKTAEDSIEVIIISDDKQFEYYPTKEELSNIKDLNSVRISFAKNIIGVEYAYKFDAIE